MAEQSMLSGDVIRSILELYGLDAAFGEQTEYISYVGEDEEHFIKRILSVLLEDGRRVVIKLLREDRDEAKYRARRERQCEFSELMRRGGIRTPRCYMANGRYCNEFVYTGLNCCVSVEDWCGEEITEITADIARRIGELMARMHLLSLENGYELGCGTLFSAANWNDVDAFERFCELGAHEGLDRSVVEQLKRLHDEKLAALRAVWDRLPRAAVQGDISINNLVDDAGGMIVFDYNNAGDEVLVSDLVMEGLLTAYEMDLPAGADPSLREQLFPAMLSGYLSVRPLSDEEAEAAWSIYTLYHALWFTRVVYNEASLEKLLEKGDLAAADRLLGQMLADMTERDDGRFKRAK